MRKYTYVNGHPQIKKVMIYESRSGVFLYLFITVEDGPCAFDQWFEDVDKAEDYVFEKYGVLSSDWIDLEDPMDNCQRDWIAHVRVKGRESGNPQWGSFEKLVDGQWVDL